MQKDIDASKPYRVKERNPDDDAEYRLEIREMRKDYPEQFTLFVKSWEAIYTAEKKHPGATYRSLGGIHGLPYSQWEGDPTGQQKPLDGTAYKGYCHHSTPLFPHWHRIYLLALEQSIGEEAAEIGAAYAKQCTNDKEAKEWIKAASELRFPYWDWTRPETETEGLPTILRDDKVTISLPGGKTETVINPLRSYSFETDPSKPNLPDGFADYKREGDNTNPLIDPTGKDSSSNIDSKFAEWKRTYRWPNADGSEEYRSIDNILKGTIQPGRTKRGGYKDLRSRVAHLFAYPPKEEEIMYPYIWDAFSNDGTQNTYLMGGTGMDDNLRYRIFAPANIEQPHNSVHLVVGGAGHMSDNNYAGYDPLFWMHHCNVDRILAFWEYIYPNYWMGGKGFQKGLKEIEFVGSTGTFATNKDDPVSENTPLVPFRRLDGNYWTAKEARQIGSDKSKMHYTYPPLADVDMNYVATEQDRLRYLARLQRHFGLDPGPLNDKIKELQKQYDEKYKGAAHPNMAEWNEAKHLYQNFVIVVKMPTAAFKGSYSLEFTYKINENDEETPFGSASILSRSDTASCANCQAQEEAQSQINAVIAVPFEIVSSISDDMIKETEGKTDWFEKMKTKITARLIEPDSTVKCKAPSSNGPPLDPAKVPNITMRSMNASKYDEPDKPKDEKDIPYLFATKDIEGDLFPAESWRWEPPNQY